MKDQMKNKNKAKSRHIRLQKAYEVDLGNELEISNLKDFQ